jgi:hypothetical protein
MDDPFVELVDLVERAVGLAREKYDANILSTESGFIAWVVIQELRRSGYKITSASGFSYPDVMGNTGPEAD